jgi:hydrophobe/amphiphile efflux-3 (HAE3) family protein
VDKFWSNLAVWLGKRAGLVAAVGLLITGILGFGITKLEFATGQDSYLNSSDQVAQDNVAYQELFGGQLMIVLFTMDEGSSVAELATNPANAKVINDAKAEIEQSPHVRTVVTPLDLLEFSANTLSRTPDAPTDAEAWDPLNSIANAALAEAAAAEEPGSPEAAARAEAFEADAARLLPFLETTPEERSLSNPEWVDVLLHDAEGNIRKPLQASFFDETHAQMIVRLTGNASLEEEGAGADAVKAAFEDRDLENGEIVITGAPVLLKDINDYLRGGLISLGAIALAFMVLILLIFFNVRWRLLPLFIVVIGVTWAFGLAGYIGIPLSVVTIAGLPVLLGVGIDYAIQMHARVEEEVVIDRASHPIQETARQLGPALLVVTFDAIFALAALRFAQVPMIRQFALLLVIGIAVICFNSIFGTLAVLGAREYRSPTTARDFREGILGRLVVRLGGLPKVMAIPFMVASVAVFLGGLAVEGQLTLQTDPVQWVNQDSQNRKDVATLEERTDASSELGVYVTAQDREQLFADETMDWLDSFTDDAIVRYPDQIKVASSVLTPLSELVEIDGASEHTPSGALVEASYLAAPPEVQEFVVSQEAPALNLLFVTRPGSLDDRAVMVDDMQERLADDGPDGAAPPEGVTATPSGLAVVGVGLLRNLEANRVELTYLAIAFVFAFLAIRLRSIVRSLLSLVPVLIAVGMTSIVAYAFDLKLSPMTAVGGPLVIAVCTEFTSLILLRFLEERRRGFSPQAAADIAASRTGRAFIVSALTTAAGLGVIATSPLPLLRDFGLVVAMNVIVALLSALVVLPPIMVWAEERRWVSRGMIPIEELGNKERDEVTPTPSMVPGAPDLNPDDDTP